MKKIGVIGQGFVGSSLREGFKNTFEVLAYDKFLTEKSNSTLEDIVGTCDVIFSCVPTPMDMESGEASIHIVKEVITDINYWAAKLDKQPVIVIKSTVPPGTCNFLDTQYSTKCPIVFNPEFLTEANAVEDFKNQDRIIIGAPSRDAEYGERVRDVFATGFPDVRIEITDHDTAEMVKYVANCFLATKVAFANEMFDICNGLDTNYDEVIKLAILDKRLGDSHWMVPGPDGGRGYGGSCFPKDLQALRYIASQLGTPVTTDVLDATHFKNNRIRENRDWEQMDGRAVINKVKV